MHRTILEMGRYRQSQRLLRDLQRGSDERAGTSMDSRGLGKVLETGAKAIFVIQECVQVLVLYGKLNPRVMAGDDR